ncbi:NYN domain-containing protein [Thermococcus sibiricus]|uniref:NYN domain-containing protein n=1 Tax=Thermococcus sibiricus TaxID=172049 RepID=UPI0024B4BCEA|nr:NYN domain-containing protein [Thermococcus sibiricus]
MSKSTSLLINEPNVLLKKFDINLQSILNAMKSLNKTITSKAILDYNIPPKLVKTATNSSLEQVIVNTRVGVAFSLEAIKRICNSKISVLILVVKGAHLLSILTEATSMLFNRMLISFNVTS